MKFKLGIILFELLVTIAILAFLVGIGFSFTVITNKSFVKIELERLYSVILFLQKSAYAKKETKSLIIDIKNNSYKFDNNIYFLSRDVKFGFVGGIMGPPSNPTKLINKVSSFKNDVIEFYKEGKISSGIIYLTDKSQKNLYALSSSASEISHIRKYFYNQKWVLLK